MHDITKKQLVRDVKREALRRMEDAARTVEDFQHVIAQWDHIDQNRERKDRYHEPKKQDPRIPWAPPPGQAMIPFLYGRIFWQNMMSGNFLDLIYAFPHTLHQLVEDKDISEILRDINTSHKEILWYWAVLDYSSAELSAMRGCTERNIRKTRVLILKNIQGKLYLRLRKRVLAGDSSVTWNMRDFVERYHEQQKNRS